MERERLYPTGMYDQAQNIYGCDSIVWLELDVTSLANGVDTSVNGSLSSVQENASYVWLDCASNYTPLANQTGQLFTPSASGTYAVEVTSNGCVDTSECIEFQMASVGVSESTFPTTISAYPNPFRARLNG